MSIYYEKLVILSIPIQFQIWLIVLSSISIPIPALENSNSTDPEDHKISITILSCVFLLYCVDKMRNGPDVTFHTFTKMYILSMRIMRE